MSEPIPVRLSAGERWWIERDLLSDATLPTWEGGAMESLDQEWERSDRALRWALRIFVGFVALNVAATVWQLVA